MRWVALLLLCGLGAAGFAADQKADPKKDSSGQAELKKRGEKPSQPATGPEEVPPEEDEALAVKHVYAFNPLQASKEMQIGSFYYKKGSYRAAEERFREATKWDGSLAEAWLRLGEAAEKNKDPQSAKEAYAKYLQVSPEAKNAPEIKKKLGKLK